MVETRVKIEIPELRLIASYLSSQVKGMELPTTQMTAEVAC